jgi:hypothetical protein
MQTGRLWKIYTIISTSQGFMIDDGDGYVHAKNGDNTFDMYNDAQWVLAQHLVNNANEGLK